MTRRTWLAFTSGTCLSLLPLTALAQEREGAGGQIPPHAAVHLGMWQNVPSALTKHKSLIFNGTSVNDASISTEREVLDAVIAWIKNDTEETVTINPGIKLTIKAHGWGDSILGITVNSDITLNGVHSGGTSSSRNYPDSDPQIVEFSSTSLAKGESQTYIGVYKLLFQKLN